MTGPTITPAMIEAAIGVRSRAMHACITDQLGRAGDKLYDLVDDALEQAYVCGQKDGWTRAMGEAIADEGIAGDGEPADGHPA